MIELRATKARLVVLRREYVSSGSSKVYEVQFHFSPDWDGLQKVAYFRIGQCEPTAPILLPLNDRCQIPAEVLYDPGKMLYIGVQGIASDEELPDNLPYLHEESSEGDESEVCPPDGSEQKPEVDPIVLPTMWCQYDIVRRGVQAANSIGMSEALLEMGQIRNETVDAKNASCACAEASEESAQKAMTAAVNSPRPSEQNTWEIYDWDAQDYIDTGSPTRGPKGEQGEQGEPGENGSDGLSAYEVAIENGFEGTAEDFINYLRQGPAGPQGPTGPQGLQGEPGPQGPKGDKGEKGEKGDTGPAGLKGDTGATGATGPTGAKGDPGVQGEKGDTGPRGDTGPQGPAGEKGEKGDQGPAGPQGEAGPKGDTGPVGPKGDTGEQGPKGDNGVGVPSGGSEGQVLTKLSDEDYDTGWTTPSPISSNPGASVLVNAPKGCIVAWSGTEEDVPDGWQVCDGTNGTPDLRDRFILGAGENHPIGEADGEEEHTLSIQELPSHAHTMPVFGQYTEPGTATDHLSAMQKTGGSTGLTGSNKAHNNMPPYYALLWIMKMTDAVSDSAENAISMEEYDADGWHVRKYSNGYVEMSTTKQYLVPTPLKQWGSMYIPDENYGGSGHIDFPITLIQKYTEQCTAQTIGGAGFICYCYEGGSKTRTAAYQIMRPAEILAGWSVVFHILVTGRWKESTDTGIIASTKPQDIYSTEETVIGRWIDGKPLYRKVIYKDLTDYTGVDYTFYQDDTLDMVINIGGFYLSVGQYRMSINSYSGEAHGANDALAVFYRKNYHSLMLRGGSSVVNADPEMWVIIEYTKTTDEATISLPGEI